MPVCVHMCTRAHTHRGRKRPHHTLVGRVSWLSQEDRKESEAASWQLIPMMRTMVVSVLCPSTCSENLSQDPYFRGNSEVQ
jgi:hypothetical protein